MCNEQRFSESGAPIAPTRCAEFVLITSDRDRLAGVVAGMEEQNARNLDALRMAEAENESLRFRVGTNKTGLMILDQRVESLEAENAKIILQYDQLDEIFRQRGFDLSQSMARALEFEKENARLELTLKRQARAMHNYQSAEAKIASAKLESARRLAAECDPANVESEKQMNAILTDENQRLWAILISLEWSGVETVDGESTCPGCWSVRGGGVHTSRCPVGNALKEVG